MSPPESTETVPAAVDVEGLELVYSDGTAAVDGVDLTVPEGEFFGFLGPNGAGSSSRFRTRWRFSHATRVQ